MGEQRTGSQKQGKAYSDMVHVHTCMCGLDSGTCTDRRVLHTSGGHCWEEMKGSDVRGKERGYRVCVLVVCAEILRMRSKN